MINAKMKPPHGLRINGYPCRGFYLALKHTTIRSRSSPIGLDRGNSFVGMSSPSTYVPQNVRYGPQASDTVAYSACSGVCA